MGGRMKPFASAKACSEELESLTSRCAADGDEGATWPFIRRVRVFLKSHILRNGLVLVDLPGLGDVNLARVQVTERHLKACDDVVAVAPTARASTNVSIARVFDLATKVGLANVGIVCTASDEDKSHEAERDRKSGPARAQIRRLREAVGELTQIHEQFEQLDYAGDAAKYHQHRDVKERLKDAKGELTKVMMETRNEEVKRALRTAYSARVPSGNFRVFCVSSEVYRNNRRKPRRPPIDWLELSGIIALRRYCRGLPADAQLIALETYVGKTVPRLIAKVRSWARRGEGRDDGERKTAVRAALDEVEGRIKAAVRGGEKPLQLTYAFITTSFQQKVYDASFAAFCRKHGTHRVGDEDERNWNEDAIVAVAADMKAVWKTWVKGLRRDILDSLVERLMAAATLAGTPLIVLLQGTPQLSDLAVSTIASRDEAMDKFERLWSDFEKGLRALHARAFSGSASSLMATALAPAYRDCKTKRGKGSKQKQHKIMEDAVDNNELFQNLMADVRQTVGDLAWTLHREVDKAANGLVKEIGETMDLIGGGHAAAEGDRASEFRRQVGEEAERAVRDMERLRMDLGLGELDAAHA